MAGDVVNIKICSLLKLRCSLTGNYHVICHYSYNLPLAEEEMKLEDIELELFVDYFQFYLQDEEVDGDLSDAWTDSALEKGIYRVRIYYVNLDTLSEDGLEGDDSYIIQLWKVSETKGLEVIKKRRASA